MKPGELIKMMAELQRFREREPLVQALLQTLDGFYVEKTYTSRDEEWDDIRKAEAALRDFKLTEDKP